VAAKPKKLSYKDQHELEQLPARIETLESAVESVQPALGDPAIYRDGAERVAELDAQRIQLEADLADAYERWEALEE
jgi:ATP-binding cassette subfamily F protein uup